MAGVILGAVALLAATWFLPVVDQHREASIISVAPNGGNFEAFHINIPDDRIVRGASNQPGIPDGLSWPASLAGVRVEAYKLRNSRDIVVGVASRVAARGADGVLLEWLLHLPARGSVYVTMETATNDGVRMGDYRHGTREFAPVVGTLAERWAPAADTGGDTAGEGLSGRIELTTAFVSTVEDDDPELIDVGDDAAGSGGAQP